MYGMTFACALYYIIIRPAISLPLYSNTNPKTYSFVVCTDLDNAVTALREAPLNQHTIGADWLETNCVTIDPCLHTNALGESVPMDTWLHGNSSKLTLTNSLVNVEAAESGTEAHNFGSFEYARIPEGLRVQTCAPNFDTWRRGGALECDVNTIKTISLNHEEPSCPGNQPYSLLNCITSLQFDSSVEHLHWRPPTQIMHFGQQTWDTACTPPYTNILVEVICNQSRDEYTIPIPKAAQYGTTSLIKYDFVPGYACHTTGILSPTQVLSREAAPNYIIDCPQVEHATIHRVDDYTCDFVCDEDYVKQDNACVSVCETFVSSCPATFQHIETCTAHGIQHYSCQECDTRAGHETVAWSSSTPMGTCEYTACGAGTFSSGHSCVDCAVNSISSTTNQTHCTSCDTLNTGLYSQQQGGTICTSCLGFAGVETIEPGSVCSHAGRAFVTDFSLLQYLFLLYHNDRPNVLLEDFVDKYCQDGYACLPCDPGYFEEEHTCQPCEYGTYQPNFGATSCVACEGGQNTTHIASTAQEQCVCLPGFA